MPLQLSQKAMHAVKPIDSFEGLETKLHKYQAHGVSKILHCWNDMNKACILGDVMGLGKTLQAILACIMDRERCGSFDLVVTTKSCAQQWRDEIDKHFDEVRNDVHSFATSLLIPDPRTTNPGRSSLTTPTSLLCHSSTKTNIS